MEATGADEFFKQLNLSKSSHILKHVEHTSHQRHHKQLSQRNQSKEETPGKLNRHGTITNDPSFCLEQTTAIISRLDANLDQNYDTESDPAFSDFGDSSDDDVTKKNPANAISLSTRREILRNEVDKGTDHEALEKEEVLKKKLKSPPYHCIVNTCNISFGNWKNFIRHLREHQSSYPYSCTRCDVNFRCRIDLMTHLKRHFGVRNICCEICGDSFEKNRGLVSHMIAKHNQIDERPRNFRCTECGEAFLCKSAVDRHMRFHTGFRPEVCKFCNACFHTEYDLKEHIRIHTGEKPFKCDQCNYFARTSQLLKRHKKSHRNAKPFHCEKCSFRCNNAQSLKRHRIKHTGNLPFKCPYCEYRCCDMDNLKKHIRKVKKHKGLKIYPCSGCQFSSDDSSEYLQHLKQCHFPNLDLKTAKASKLSGIFIDITHTSHIPEDITELGHSQSPVHQIGLELLQDSYEMNRSQITTESLYPHSKGDILLSSTAFDNDAACKEGAFPSGSFNETTCWVPAVCGGPSLHDKMNNSPRVPEEVQTQECIAILIEPCEGQKIEIHSSSNNLQLKLHNEIVTSETLHSVALNQANSNK